MTTLSSRLRELRVEKKLRQIDVAYFLEINERSYQQMEYGKAQPKLANLIKLSDFYGVSLDYLIGKTDRPTFTDENERNVQRALQHILEELSNEYDFHYCSNGAEEMDEEDTLLMKKAVEAIMKKAIELEKKKKR